MMILTLLLCTAVYFGIGYLWYSPLLFSNLWVKAKGWTPETFNNPEKKEAMKQAMIRGFAGSFVIAFIQVCVLAFCIVHGSLNMTESALFAALMSFTFCFLHEVSGSLWGESNWTLLLINTGHDFVAATIVATLLGYLLGA